MASRNSANVWTLLDSGGSGIDIPAFVIVVPPGGGGLPLCRDLTVSKGETLLGVTLPAQDKALEVRSFELGLFYEKLTVCNRSWDEVVSIQKGAGEVQWADVKGVRDLDRVLMDHNLRPELQVAEVTLKPVHGKVALLQALGVDEQLKEVDSGEKLETTGRKEIRANERFVEVTVQEQAEKVGLKAAERATKLSPVIGEPVKEEVTEVAETEEVKPAPVTAWVSADDVEYFDFAPAIIVPVGKVFRVYRPLNFRGSPGVQHQALRAPLPRGTVVEVIGPTQRDWWKVKVMDTGEEGWVNSLWLRIAGEGVRPAPETRTPRLRGLSTPTWMW